MIVYLYIIPCAIIATVLHELSHALMSTWLGDPTPKEDGRLTLNPLKHYDLIGTICLILFRIGWAKPVRVDSRYYKNPKWGTALVALAGPAMNFILAILSVFISVLLIRYESTTIGHIAFYFFSYLAIINIGFGVFNLIPIPPLDGSRIFGAFLPNDAYYRYMSYERYGMFIILGILLLADIVARMTGSDASLITKAMQTIYEALFNLFVNILIR